MNWIATPETISKRDLAAARTIQQHKRRPPAIVEALIESIAWQIAKDAGMSSPAEAMDEARQVALEQCNG